MYIDGAYYSIYFCRKEGKGDYIRVNHVHYKNEAENGEPQLQNKRGKYSK